MGQIEEETNNYGVKQQVGSAKEAESRIGNEMGERDGLGKREDNQL